MNEHSDYTPGERMEVVIPMQHEPKPPKLRMFVGLLVVILIYPFCFGYWWSTKIWKSIYLRLYGHPPRFDKTNHLTVNQAANELYYSQSSVRRFIRAGKLKAYKVDGQYYIEKWDVYTFKPIPNKRRAGMSGG